MSAPTSENGLFALLEERVAQCWGDKWWVVPEDGRRWAWGCSEVDCPSRPDADHWEYMGSAPSLTTALIAIINAYEDAS